MKVSYNWLKDYIDLDVTPEELANKITLTGIEVEDTFHPDAGLKKIVVGYVVSTKPHPNSDHLQLCQVDLGASDPVQIVCGAPNVAAGQKVIVALPGSRIANNEKIKKGKMRGEVSNGMICALQEIGFSTDVAPQAYADGIYVLPADAKVGAPVYPYLGMDDAILDLAITPNRADAQSMRGVAYEVGAVYAKKPHFDVAKPVETAKPVTDVLQASVAAEKDAPSYNLRVIENVKIQPSPLWLQIRLWNAGIRPINNVVDVTNYVMLDYGQPMHAFDYDKIGSKEILVRRATEGEALTTLDGNEHELSADDIVISNGTKAINLAGVMGGLDSEITDQTTTVVLEAAIFDPMHIRKSAQRYNLRSEASSRFEKGINKGTVLTALDHAASLIADFSDGDVLAGILSPTKIVPAATVVEVSQERINHVLGMQISAAEITKIFKRLAFGVSEMNGQFKVSVPTHRWDISIPADLIEEVARLYGYDKMPTTLPASASTPGILTPQQRRVRQMAQLLEASGLNQAISYALTTSEKASQFTLIPAATTSVAWPMTVDHAVLRMNLVSGLLDNLAYNIARKQVNVALYEQGRVFLKQDAKTTRPEEVEYVAGAVTGDWQAKTWNQAAKPVDFYQIKGIVAALLNQFNLKATVTYHATATRAEMHPGRTADIYVGDQLVGFVGQIHPQVEKVYRIKPTYVFQLNLTALLTLEKQAVVYQAISKYPVITRDVALLVASDVTNQAITDAIFAKGGAHLKNVTLFDSYTGSKIEKGKKSLAYTLTYQNPGATLTDDEVNTAFAKVEKTLVEQIGAVIR
ncbi:phenylalanine--tRNA ligase subunit beta [Loigolactobacillus backii]|uniref:Phenylalanine--tRNA ligase beta subunit n=1 Tax=Loigolactobacillus backii TaxID=375175 RepID=A0A192H441_9LACO|nr:phenylalanine--tRNA ligase subunit beta [Loigolactobacillus backii]ANK59323.1 phenylalanine--tRNA ligase subunit beta [Loigolactobacillus backii]ANK62736.1 phenylalanine--tRNA ligase subunit beta [Loigolactobacillus backii]ANK64315.1 phenylalanine--tRNA ligase subunit beta [Loigolactobacillus backii]ANK70256.1 phenylalanine--tRNA ligase subunit beta [Loigolactobacillus backii]MDA5388537.1 phenylalanine--tRNA ligase subunit beta [Loigolactobacillus backii]